MRADPSTLAPQADAPTTRATAGFRFKDEFALRSSQLRGSKDKQNTDYHQRAQKLAREALESADWTAEEKRAAAEAIAEWLPKVIERIDKDALKKLKLAALRGNA